MSVRASEVIVSEASLARILAKLTGAASLLTKLILSRYNRGLSWRTGLTRHCS